VFAVQNDDRRHVLQGIHALFEIKPSAPWGGDQPTNKIVVIGRDLDRDALAVGLGAVAVEERRGRLGSGVRVEERTGEGCDGRRH
jgi:G3E family GTPase